MPYSLTPEDFNKFSEDILQANGDQATLTTLLADMNTTITEAIARDLNSAKQVETVTAENERLKKANMDLFLRIGSPKEEEKKEEEPETPKDTKAYMSDYFNRLDASDKK